MATVSDSVMSYQWPERFWEHQQYGCQQTVECIEAGMRKIMLTSPTGMGKTAMMLALIEWATYHGRRAILYTNRRMLFDQTARDLEAHGIEYGLRAAGHKPALLRDVQLAMTPSEYSKVVRKKKWALHPADIVLGDEIHMQGGEMLTELFEQHANQGGTIIGVTATPIDVDGIWDKLIIAGRTSDGRRCGALLPAYTYCPDQPDMKHIKRYNVGEDLTDAENHSAIMRPGVFGRVWDHWCRLNPERKPTILFGPDVAGSVHFAEQFYAKGVTAAHIDAKQIWVNGDYIESNDENRQEIIAASERGEITVICNRFVLREGINMPHLAHAIFACVFGSLKSYIQAGGRVLRAHPSLTDVTIQDHGANFIRHGSLNADRLWELGMRGYRITGMRQDAMREKPELEPIICPKCGMGRLSGPTCIKCGYASHKRSRAVVQIDGSLKYQEGPSFRPRRIKVEPDTEAIWRQCYHRAKNKKWDATFNQAEALFFRENYYYPPRTLPLMPKNAGDWYEKVADVPTDRLL